MRVVLLKAERKRGVRGIHFLLRTCPWQPECDFLLTERKIKVTPFPTFS